MRALQCRYPPEDPAEIIKRVHAVIARQDPDRAVLVARWNRLQEGKRRAEAGKVQPAPGRGRQERIQEYGDLLAQGLSRAEAAAVLGIILDTASRYEVELRRQGRIGDRGDRTA